MRRSLLEEEMSKPGWNDGKKLVQSREGYRAQRCF